MSFSAANIVFVSNKIAEHIDTFPKAAGRQTLAAGLIFVNVTYVSITRCDWAIGLAEEPGENVFQLMETLRRRISVTINDF